jgi:hypothetical protein
MGHFLSAPLQSLDRLTPKNSNQNEVFDFGKQREIGGPAPPSPVRETEIDYRPDHSRGFPPRRRPPRPRRDGEPA